MRNGFARTKPDRADLISQQVWLIGKGGYQRWCNRFGPLALASSDIGWILFFGGLQRVEKERGDDACLSAPRAEAATFARNSAVVLWQKNMDGELVVRCHLYH